MQFLRQLDPLTIGLAAAGISILVNLMALGFLLGRGDGKMLRIIDKLSRRQKRDSRRLRQQQALIHKEVRKRLGDFKVQLQKLERRQDSLAALQLTQGARVPTAGMSPDRGASAGPDPLGENRRSPRTRRYSPIDKKHHIYSLARRGVPSQDISRRLKVSRGETELVLGLKQFIHSQEPGAGSAAATRQELPN